MVKVYNSGSSLETQQILDTLNENQIPAYKKDIGAGGYMAISTGMSISGADIYVSEEKRQEAEEIIAAITGSASLESESAEEGTGNDWKRRLFASVMLVIILAGIVTALFFT